MTNSQFCVRQRQQERQRLNKLLILGFAGSAIVHGVLAYALPRWSSESTKTAEEPMELILVDKPKPKPKPAPKPKVESKPIVEPKPKPVKPPEPVQAKNPPPPPKPPEPVEAQTPPPKPVPEAVPEPAPEPAPEAVPKEVLTTPAPAPSQPIVSAPVENTAQPSSLSSNFTAPSSSSVTSTETSSDSPGAPSSAVATNSAPPRPESNSEPEEGISCVSNCEPEYPATLEGVEGSAGVKLTIDPDGNVMGAELASPDSNSQVNRQALLAARQMEFSSPGDSAASVQVKIDFTVEGSEYDRLAREEQEKREQAQKEQEAARQQQLEAEKQAQQEQLERERQARQEQLQQQQESTPPPAPQAEPAPKPLPALSPEELEEAMQRGLGGSPHERLHQEERLRKFRERMENYQEE